MPLSYKVIKHHQVHITNEDFKVPTIMAEHFNETGNEKSSKDIERNYIKEKVEKLIQSAEHEAKLILKEANKNAKDVQKKAQTEGYNQGLKKGQEEGYSTGYSKAVEETKEIKEHAKRLLTNAHETSREYIRKTKEEIIDLSISIAQGIVYYSIDKNNKDITEIAKNVLQKAEESKQIIFRAPPEYLIILKNNKDEFVKICPMASFVFLEDKEVEDRSCIIETDTQIMDLQIDKQLENIKTSLLEMRKENEL